LSTPFGKKIAGDETDQINDVRDAFSFGNAPTVRCAATMPVAVSICVHRTDRMLSAFTNGFATVAAGSGG